MVVLRLHGLRAIQKPERCLPHLLREKRASKRHVLSWRESIEEMECVFTANPIAVPEQPNLAGSALGGAEESFSANPGQDEAPASPGRMEQEAPQHPTLLRKGAELLLPHSGDKSPPTGD